jgi:hypothetical protein
LFLLIAYLLPVVVSEINSEQCGNMFPQYGDIVPGILQPIPTEVKVLQPGHILEWDQWNSIWPFKDGGLLLSENNKIMEILDAIETLEHW